MTATELDDAFDWFHKASGVQVGTNEISGGDSPLFFGVFAVPTTGHTARDRPLVSFYTKCVRKKYPKFALEEEISVS